MASAESPKMSPVKTFCPDHLKEARDEFLKANITCLVYSHDGTELLCSYNDEDIYLFDADHSSGSNYISKYTGHRNSATVKGVNFYGPKSEYVVSGSDCGNVFLWDKKNTNIVQCVLGDHEGVVNCLEPHPYLPVLAVSGLDHDVKVFTPTADQPTKLEDLSQKVEANKEARERSRDQEPLDPLEALLFRHIIRRYRRRLREYSGDGVEGDDDDDDDNDSDSSGENSDTSSDEGGPYVVHDVMGDDQSSSDSNDSDTDRPPRPRIAQCIQS